MIVIMLSLYRAVRREVCHDPHVCYRIHVVDVFYGLICTIGIIPCLRAATFSSLSTSRRSGDVNLASAWN